MMDARGLPVGRGISSTFLRWTFARAVFHRGYVLASGLYFVINARLSGYQLLILATVMSITLLLSDIPFGVWSDAFSRKWPLVIGHVFLAAGMVMTGLVTAFPLLLVTQVLWGLGWAFSTGADVAWVTDELDQPGLIARVLTARARWDLMGGVVGMTAFGVLGWVIGLGGAIVITGAAMAVVGIFVALRFREDNFTPARARKWKTAVSIFRRGLRLSRGDREVLLVLVATMCVNGAAVISWAFPKQLVDRGFPSSPVLWYAALGILSFGVGILALHFVEVRIERVGGARRTYALTCLVGMMGLLVLAYAPTALEGSTGILVVSGITFNVTRTVSSVWINRRTPSDIRATMHSILSQAESVGEIAGGAALAGWPGCGGSFRRSWPQACWSLLRVSSSQDPVLIARSRADRYIGPRRCHVSGPAGRFVGGTHGSVHLRAVLSSLRTRTTAAYYRTDLRARNVGDTPAGGILT